MLFIQEDFCKMAIMLPDNFLEIKISDVSITNVGFAIFLKPVDSSGGRVVPIFIGPLETYSISSALDGINPPRPNTHDLLVNMLQEMEANVLRVVINDIIGSIFYARIVVKTEDGIVELDARPSDSVAVAIRTKCPMYIHEKVYQEASVVLGEENSSQENEDSEPPSAPIKQKEEPKTTGQPELEKLKKALNKAVEAENFEEAAELRDRINEITQKN